MFRSILVPLDRSTFAEQALPLAVGIARRANARLALVVVHASYDLDERIPVGAHFEPERDAERTRQEQIYLDAVAGRVASATGVSATAVVLPGSAVLPETVADGILERAAAGTVDLIVMATHARGAVGRLGAGGSVADELIRRSDMPILLVKPDELPSGFTPDTVLDQILIPLDGSAVAEQVLEPALNLAHLMQARCDLLRVVESRSQPADRPADRPPGVSQAEEYLARVAETVRGKGLQVGTRVIVAPDVVEAILAGARGYALVAMAGQGHTRLGRLFLGSTAERVILGVRSPVLAYRPAVKEC